MVNNDGSVLMDEYVQPQESVTDYRTAVSGILPAHLKDGAISMQEAQQQVANVLKGRILVGHSVHHDLQVIWRFGSSSGTSCRVLCRFITAVNAHCKVYKL